MAAAAASRPTNTRPVGGRQDSFPVAASTTIYKGTLVFLNSSGYLVPAASTATLKPGAMLAHETVNNSSGSNGDKSCVCEWHVVADFAATSITQAMVGDPMYAVYDNEIDDVGTNNRYVGPLVEYVSTTRGKVFLPGPSTAAINARTLRARSVWFDLDNGSGTTIDDVIMKPTTAITITAARIIYVDATSGTVAAGNVKIGSTLAGTEVTAATAYENAKAVGTSTAMTIVSGAIAAGGAVFVRHTGVAATAAGQACVEIEYYVNA